MTSRPRAPNPEARRDLLVLCLSLIMALTWTLLPPPLSRDGRASASGRSVVSAPLGGHAVDLNAFFTKEERAAWKTYSQARLRIHLVGLGSILLFYLALVLTGFNQRLRAASERVAKALYGAPRLGWAGGRWPVLRGLVRVPERLFGGKEWLEVLVYCLLFIFLIRLFFFPQVFLRTYWFDLHYGLSNYTLGLWIVDYLKGLVLGTMLFSLMVFGIYGLMTRLGNRWWIPLWVGVSIAIFGYVAIAPYGARIYSNFRSLEEGELRDRLEQLANREGFPLDDILVVDASRRTKKANAYITGSGPSKRIILYDTLVDRFTPREITMILAHEMAHWKSHDKALSYLLFSVTVFGVLLLANTALKLGTRIRRFHYTSPRDVAGLPVLFLTFFLIFQLLRPVNLYWKRVREQEADRRSLEMVCDPEAFISTHVKLARLNHTDVSPSSLVVYLFSSHPPFLERIETALRRRCPPGSQQDRESL